MGNENSNDNFRDNSLIDSELDVITLINLSNNL